MSEWTDELKEKVIKMYQAANPTAENSGDIVQDIADAVDKTVNGVRMVLIRAEVYVKKNAGNGGGEKAAGSKRINKADAINGLVSALEAQEVTVDEEIIGKLTGKAAVYFTNVVNELTAN